MSYVIHTSYKVNRLLAIFCTPNMKPFLAINKPCNEKNFKSNFLSIWKQKGHPENNLSRKSLDHEYDRAHEQVHKIIINVATEIAKFIMAIIFRDNKIRPEAKQKSQAQA